MRKIEIVDKPCSDSIFSIDKFVFRLGQKEKSQMIKYQIELELINYGVMDVRFLLEEVDSDFKFLLTVPEELVEYIKKYEESTNPEDECLFHDIRTKYIDFIANKEKDGKGIEDELIILGYSLLQRKIYLVIKAFSLYGLSSFLQKVIKYCDERLIKINIKEDIRWIQLNQYMCLDMSEERRNGNSRDFLKRTLVENNFMRFREIFLQIDREGYFGKNFYEKIMIQTRKDKTGREIPVRMNQVSKFFVPYWKYSIGVNDKGKDVLCLHDEMLSDENMDDYVYTFKPSLMRYYLQNWFEDFTVEIVKNMRIEGGMVKYVSAGKRYNFFEDDNDNNIREIDVVIGIEINSVLKLIAIECKKTLSNKEIRETNKKCKEKIINSGNNVFDAFMHIGCFKGDVSLDKRIEGTKEEYKQSIIEGDYMDAPYYAFVIKSINDYEMKLKYMITDIFKNW